MGWPGHEIAQPPRSRSVRSTPQSLRLGRMINCFARPSAGPRTGPHSRSPKSTARRFGWQRVALGVFLTVCVHLVVSASPARPPSGFIALFNGEDLNGWRGGDTFDHRKLLAMPAAQRNDQIAKWTAEMKPHWTVEKGELVNDGKGAY